MADKVFWFDLETSGLNHHEHGIIQLAGIIEIDGVLEETINHNIEPAESCIIDNDALRVNNYTHREIQSHDNENLVFKKLRNLFSRYIDKYDSDDKFFVGGYNVAFDIDFLSAFWDRNKTGDQYLGSYINRSMAFDPYFIIPYLVDQGELSKPNSMKLKYVCKKYLDEANYQWHDAFADIEASRDLYKEIKGR